MARLSYIDDAAKKSVKELAERISAQRNGNLPNLFRMLLHSPNVAAGWFDFLSSIRKESILDGRTREFVIIYVAMLLRADYPINDHIPIALKEGITQDEMDALESWHTSSLFDQRDRALLAYVEESSENVQVPDDVFEDLRRQYSDREVIEITVLIGAYHLVARFLEALQIDLEPS
jgi:alkylhydroperoxidase family enzyme